MVWNKLKSLDVANLFIFIDVYTCNRYVNCAFAMYVDRYILLSLEKDQEM